MTPTVTPIRPEKLEEYRGWTITRGRWPEPEWSATGPNYEAWTEGEGEWVSNGQHLSAATGEALMAEIDAWYEEHVVPARTVPLMGDR